FETYPELPYLLAAPVTKIFGAPAALVAIAFVGMSLLGLGLYGTVRTSTGSTVGGLVASLAALGSLATWTWIVNGGVEARLSALVRYGGFASAFLGLDRPSLTSPAGVLIDPRHIGVALVPIIVLSLIAAGSPRRAVVLLAGALALVTLYLFAPDLGIPTHLYY